MVATRQLVLLALKYGILAILIGVCWVEEVGGGLQVSSIGSTGYRLYTQDRAVMSVIVTLIQEVRVNLHLPIKAHQETRAKLLVIGQKI